MNNNKLDHEKLGETKISALENFGLFAAKAVFITILFSVVLDLFLPDFSKWHDLFQNTNALTEPLKNERTKFYLLSFVQNPVALYKAAEIYEREGKIDKAILNIEMAIGLLELHNADKQVVKRYYERLNTLKSLIQK